MALTSVYYDGPVTETDRAKNRAGAPDYGVYGADDFRVSTHPSIPYALTVKAGRAHGWGVTDTALTDQQVNCPTLASGTRWDLIVLSRNWQPRPGSSTLGFVTAGTTAQIPAGRKANPGVEDDQPLALVQWIGGQNTPAQIIDLRCWAGNGGLEAADKLALTYLAKPGAAVKIGPTVWKYEPKGNGVWGWTAYPYMLVDVGQGDRQPLIKAGNARVNTTPYGDAYFNFPTPFPNALTSCTVTDATDPAFWPAMIVKFAAVYSDRTRFGCRVYDHAGNALPNLTNLNLTYVATGY